MIAKDFVPFMGIKPFAIMEIITESAVGRCLWAEWD